MKNKAQIMAQIDHQRIAAAIEKAEQQTSGEIFTVLARQSDDYVYVAGFFAALWSLALGLLIALLGHLTALPLFAALTSPLPLALAQMTSLAISLTTFYFFPQLRLLCVPRSIAYRRASHNAVRQFLAHGIHTTQERTGILIFVSHAEHYVEVIADAGIHAHVKQEEWDKMVALITQKARNNELTDGFIVAIEKAAEILAAHFPPQKGQKNELDNHLIEI